ncbi:DUF718 domain-containing protein [Bradyrhizobium sp. UFLA05-109]
MIATKADSQALGALPMHARLSREHYLPREKSVTVTAFNTVRFRVKAGRDQEFLDAHKTIGVTWHGLLHANIIKTGDRSYCIIAEWKNMDACIAARPDMISTLNSFRDTLEDLGGGLGVTDPVAGPVILSLK